MGDGQHCAILKLLTDDLLDDAIVFDIYIRSRFIY